MKLDLGCGKNKKEGWIGVDSIQFEGVDVVCNLGKDKWPWEDNSIEEAQCSHMVEHLDAKERIHFVNELFRVLKPQGKCLIVTPSATSGRAYGDLTHQWPPVVEMWYYYLNKEWRATQAPHDDIQWNPDGYSCDFDASWGYALHGSLLTKNVEYQQFAITFFREAAQDLIATITKKG